jgi:hypothetical protein
MSLKYGSNRFQPRAQDVSGQVGWTRTGAVVHLTTITDDVAIGAAAMVGTEKVRIVGILRADDSVNNLAGLELTDGDSLPVSAGGVGRIRYNSATNLFEASENGGAYTPFVGSAGVGWTRVGTIVELTTITDDVAIGAAAMVGTEKVLIVGSLAFNASPGVTGTIRLTDTNNITWFNAATTYGLVSGQGTTLYVGGPYPTRPPTVFIESATTTEIMSGGVVSLQADNTTMYTNVPDFYFGSTVLAPKFYQQASAAAGVLCDRMLLEAQGATNAAGGASLGYGGQLRLSGGPLGGHADNKAGNVVLGLTDFTWAQCGNMEGGIVVAAAHAAPTANPSAGSKLIWSDSVGLNMRDEFGVVTLL